MKKDKIKLIIDFDGTIFNYQAFKKEIFSLFKRMGYQDEEIETTYKAEILDYKYSPLDQLDRLKKFKNTNDDLARARFNNLFKDSYQYIFPDTNDFLSEMKKRGFELVLLTLGDIEFQKAKVINSKTTDLFDAIYYTEIQKWNYLDNVINKNEKFIYIDDRADAVYKIMKKYPQSFSLFINRPENEISESQIEHLSEIIQIKSLKHAEKLLI